MNHEHIETHGLVERYLQGRLPPDEEASFEAHFTGCPRCTEQLETERELRLAMKAMTAEDMAAEDMAAEDVAAKDVAAGRTGRSGRVIRFARLGPAARLGLAAAALVLAIGLPLSVGLITSRGGQDELVAARAEVGTWRQRLETEQQEAAELRDRLQTAEARAREAEAQSRQPLVNTPVFLLAAVRGGTGPSAVIDLDEVGDHLALAVDIGADPRIASVDLTITATDGTTTWHGDGLRPNALEAVVVTFPSSLFAPGDYRLRVDGRRGEGEAIELATYRFTVRPAG
jgi:hypothetical protein